MGKRPFDFVTKVNKSSDSTTIKNDNPFDYVKEDYLLKEKVGENQDIHKQTQYDKGYLSSYANLDLYKAKQQPFYDQLGNSLAKVVPGSALAVVESVGDIGELLDFQEHKDYNNVFTELAKKGKEALNEKFTTYQEGDPNKLPSLHDSGWWFNFGDGIVQSLAGFYLVGAGLGGALSKSAKAITSVIANNELGLQLGQGVAQLGTATALSYTEGVQIGSEVYLNVKDQALKDGMTDAQAKQKASEAAAETVKLNTLLATPLNITGLSSVFKSYGKLADPVRRELTRKAGETIPKYIERLSFLEKQIPQATGIKDIALSTLREGTQEAFEEGGINLFAESEGYRKAGNRKDLVRSNLDEGIERFADILFSEEGAVNALGGAVGGIFQNLGLEHAPIAKYNGQRVSADRKQQLEQNEYKNQLVATLKQDLGTIQTNQEALNKAVENGDKTAIEIARNNMFNITALRSIRNETVKELANEISQYGSVDNTVIGEDGKTDAQRQGLADNIDDNKYKETAARKSADLIRLNKDYRDLQTRLGNKVDNFTVQEVFRKRLELYTTESVLQDIHKSIAENETTLATILPVQELQLAKYKAERLAYDNAILYFQEDGETDVVERLKKGRVIVDNLHKEEVKNNPELSTKIDNKANLLQSLATDYSDKLIQEEELNAQKEEYSNILDKPEEFKKNEVDPLVAEYKEKKAKEEKEVQEKEAKIKQEKDYQEAKVKKEEETKVEQQKKEQVINQEENTAFQESMVNQVIGKFSDDLHAQKDVQLTGDILKKYLPEKVGNYTISSDGTFTNQGNWRIGYSANTERTNINTGEKYIDTNTQHVVLDKDILLNGTEKEIKNHIEDRLNIAGIKNQEEKQSETIGVDQLNNLTPISETYTPPTQKEREEQDRIIEEELNKQNNLTTTTYGNHNKIAYKAQEQDKSGKTIDLFTINKPYQILHSNRIREGTDLTLKIDTESKFYEINKENLESIPIGIYYDNVLIGYLPAIYTIYPDSKKRKDNNKLSEYEKKQLLFARNYIVKNKEVKTKVTRITSGVKNVGKKQLVADNYVYTPSFLIGRNGFFESSKEVIYKGKLLNKSSKDGYLYTNDKTNNDSNIAFPVDIDYISDEIINSLLNILDVYFKAGNKKNPSIIIEDSKEDKLIKSIIEEYNVDITTPDGLGWYFDKLFVLTDLHSKDKGQDNIDKIKRNLRNQNTYIDFTNRGLIILSNPEHRAGKIGTGGEIYIYGRNDINNKEKREKIFKFLQNIHYRASLNLLNSKKEFKVPIVNNDLTFKNFVSKRTGKIPINYNEYLESVSRTNIVAFKVGDEEKGEKKQKTMVQPIINISFDFMEKQTKENLDFKDENQIKFVSLGKTEKIALATLDKYDSDEFEKTEETLTEEQKEEYKKKCK